MIRPRSLLLVSLVLLTACSGRERDITLRDLRTNQRSPEEFSILPVRPLEAPASLTELPTPTPGQANRTDPSPKADAVAALGGNPNLLNAGQGIPSSDGALVRQATRLGTDPNVRSELAAQDLELRKRKSLFSWSIIPRDDYGNAYRQETLDPYSELQRWRQTGARTPAADPTSR